MFSNNGGRDRELRPVCTLSWTSARSNHTAIMTISASPSSVLVQLSGAICKSAEQEMRLPFAAAASKAWRMCWRGLLLSRACPSRRVPPGWRARGVISKSWRWGLRHHSPPDLLSSPKWTDWWGFTARIVPWTFCSSSYKNEKLDPLIISRLILNPLLNLPRLLFRWKLKTSQTPSIRFIVLLRWVLFEIAVGFCT